MRKINRETGFVLVMFLFTVFSGALRKWVVPDKTVGNIVLLIQLLMPFSFFLTPDRRLPFGNRFFMIYFFYAFTCAINPMNLTLGHGILGIMIHIGFWYLLFYYVNNRDKLDLVKLIPAFIFVCAGEVVLGFIQYGLPADHFLNKYADLEAAGGSVASVGDAVRVCGTFSYIGGYTSFLLFYSFFIWALIKYQYNAFITVTLLFLGMLGAFMSGSRTATFTYGIFLFYLIVFEFKKLHWQNIFKSLIIPILILVMISLIKGNLGFEEKIVKTFDNFNERRTSNAESGEEQRRIFWDWEQLWNFKGNYPIYGVGLGSTYQGAIATFGKSDYVTEIGYLETENTRIVVEGGFILLGLRFAMAIYLVSQLMLDRKGKIFLGFFMLFLLSYVFNIYNAMFAFLGIALLDSVYYKTQKLKPSFI